MEQYLNIVESHRAETITKRPKHVPPPALLQIFVKTLSGKTITVDAFSTDTVEVLKIMIYLKERIPVIYQRLLCATRSLKNDQTLLSYEVEDHSTVHLSINWTTLEEERQHIE